MPNPRIAAAQVGVPLAEVQRSQRGASRAKRGAAAGVTLSGPFLSPRSLSQAERRRILDGFDRVLAGAFAHLPLKRARYASDPVQRLCILRTQIETLSDEAFHYEMADIVMRLRDAHTRYIGPESLARLVAALPFMIEMIGSSDAPSYLVTKVRDGLDPDFKPGVVIESWNGVPIDLAVLRFSEHCPGGRPDTQRACAILEMTFRALRYGPPPDEHWVIVGYRALEEDGLPGDALQEIRLPWSIIDPDTIDPVPWKELSGIRAGRLRRNLAIDPAAADIRRAKMLLFAPRALTGKQSAPPRTEAARVGTKALEASVIATRHTEVFKVMRLEAPGGPFGYLRIFGFDLDPDAFLKELLRLIPLLPDHGLIIDIRGNPGGAIYAAEMSLQLFTPKPIQPTRFSLLATPFVRAMAGTANMAAELEPWRASLEAAVRNGELYSQPIPITSVAKCNALGQRYGGPVVLIGDSTTYSAGDLFAAGFVDNEIGPFLCVGTATGAGGANVWEYAYLKEDLAGTSVAMPTLPDGVDLSFSFRRATRSGPSEGRPIEDVGVEADETYAMTREDLLYGNVDLLGRAIEVLRKLPASGLRVDHRRANRTVTIATAGLDRVDVYIDQHPMESIAVDAKNPVAIPYPKTAKRIELRGYSGSRLRQVRRLPLGGG